ncbi:MAG TPA: non-homologous end-joining DNA ligase [Mycobacteriales bacterium]|nr:non-homologous end-joining DNA ligase [Mycobacteriales bacterium]
MAELTTYRRKRDFAKTPEPAPTGGRGRKRPKAPTFVVQEHHARALHWDFRLEREGVLVSWAVPKGLPLDPKANHLAVMTEDHPLAYGKFEGEIPKGEYGGGQVILWDQGTYDLEKWDEREVKFVLHGERVTGRYVLFRTRGKNWMIHRMRDQPPGAFPTEGWESPPVTLMPMLATTGGGLPGDDGWGFEFKWDGVRALVFVEGGRARAMSRNLLDITASYPELADMAESLGARQAVLDGELVVFDPVGRTDFGLLQQRMKLTGAAVRRMAQTVPVVYLAFDVLHLDGHSTLDLPYTERRALLESLGLNGPSWQVPPYFPGEGAAVQEASITKGFEGIIAKRLDSQYRPGRRSDAWRKVKNIRRQELVIGGWTRGEGARAGHLGALLVGYYDDEGQLRYAGHVGTGFTQATLRDLGKELGRLQRADSPFDTAVPRAHAAKSTWVEPELVCEVEFTEWTRDGKLRHPSYKGLRYDKTPSDVVREPV